MYYTMSVEASNVIYPLPPVRRGSRFLFPEIVLPPEHPLVRLQNANKVLTELLKVEERIRDILQPHPVQSGELHSYIRPSGRHSHL